MSSRPPKCPTPVPVERQSGGLPMKWLILSVVAACLIGGILLVFFEKSRSPSAGVSEALDQESPLSVATPVDVAGAKPQAAVSEVSNLVDDDGKTLWASPTSGPPLDLAYLPPGCQVIVALREGGELGRQQLRACWLALGPHRPQLEDYVDLGLPKSSFPSLVLPNLLLGFQISSEGKWLMTLVAPNHRPLKNAAEVEVFEGILEELFPGFEKRTYQGETYRVRDGQARWFSRKGAANGVFVYAPEESIKDIIDLGGNPPPLRRDLERLLPFTDNNRPVTILFVPSVLFGDGQGIFSGEFARLRGPLFWFLGDGLSAAALSANWDENFFLELVAMPTLDVSAEKAAGHLAERVLQMPDLIEEYVLQLNPQPYGRRVVARFPAMVRKLAAYTRSGVEKDCAVLRCYLPAVAGHNLVMGAELTLAETPGVESTRDARVPVADFGRLSPGEATSPASSASVRDILARKTSLSFTRDSLEAALEQLSQDIGVEIVIVGPDLQADGITRNQQLGIHLENQPAADILVEILRKANPDKTATSASDPRQKLVYVVKPKSAGGPEAVFVTTRSRAAERGEELPAAFRP